MGSWWHRPGRAWFAVATLMALGSALAYTQPTTAIDWQPALWLNEPWRAISAVFVHYSARHLVGNIAGIALVAALGAAARAPPRLALAWLAAWPVTHIGLLLQPAIEHYGGLSGVIHAGTAIICVHLLVAGHRLLGSAMFFGMLAKVLSETPWGTPLRHPAGWDIAIAPLVHASGLVAGTGLAALAESLAGRCRDRAGADA